MPRMVLTDKTDSIHHFIPQFYLRNFRSKAEGDRSFIFKYESGTVEEGNIHDFAGVRGYYNFEKIDNHEVSSELEELFQKIESQSAPVIKGILETSATEISISAKERERLLSFISTLYIRVPKFRSKQESGLKKIQVETIKLIARDPVKFKDLTQKAGVAFSSEADLENARLAAVKFEEHFTLDLSGGEGMFLRESLELSSVVFMEMSQKRCSIIRFISDQVLVTSDAPITLLPYKSPYSGGLRFSAILLPISPNKLIVLDDQEDTHAIRQNVAGVKMLRKVNAMVMSSAKSQVYSNVPSRSIGRRCSIYSSDSEVETKTLGPDSNKLIIMSDKDPLYYYEDVFRSS